MPISVPIVLGNSSTSSDQCPTLQGNDEAARVSQLYDTYGSACYGLARQIVRDVHLAEDVVQEVFTAAWSGAATYDPDRGSVRAWVLGLTHHKSVDAVRRHQRHAGRAAGVGALDVIANEVDVEQDVWRAVRRTHVLTALRALSDVQREVLVLAYFGAHTQAEISAITGIALGTVKTRTVAALNRLRVNLDRAAIGLTEP
jgi:RNA polymerase sigma factor (sigma-70 family)